MNFAETVFKFYRIEAFKEHLFNAVQSKNADIVFQDAVATLLSLSGCSVVILGKKGNEVLRTKSGFELGSVDLIAYYKEKDRLSLIDCTTGAVDEPKIRKLQQIIKDLSSEEERSCSRVFGLIPSPRDCSYIKRQYWEDINIIDKSDLERILNFINKGEVEDARRKFFF